VKEIWPLLKDRLPDARLLIIGSKMPETIWALQQYERVIPIGFVPDIGEYLDHCRLTVAPLRYGAGIKGKIASSGAYGVPAVATTVAVEGMGLRKGHDILVADTPHAFADQVVRLYTDETLWNRLSSNILDFVEKHYSPEAGKRRISNLLTKLGAAADLTPDPDQHSLTGPDRM
jgi:glycosyltransferase involved in cell wall biosynthesis